MTLRRALFLSVHRVGRSRKGELRERPSDLRRSLAAVLGCFARIKKDCHGTIVHKRDLHRFTEAAAGDGESSCLHNLADALIQNACGTRIFRP